MSFKEPESIEFAHAEPLVPLRVARREPIDYSTVPTADADSTYESFLDRPVAINLERPAKELLVTNADGRTLTILIQSYRRAAQEFDDGKDPAVDGPQKATNAKAKGVVVAGANMDAMENGLRDSLDGGKIIWIGRRKEDPEDHNKEICILAETRDGQRAFWIYPNSMG